MEMILQFKKGPVNFLTEPFLLYITINDFPFSYYPF
jgi:hypothetical protein